MSRSSQPPYLRLVESSPEIIPVRREETERTILGFVDMSRASDLGLETILFRIRPAWVFDLRPVPYFDIGALNRKRMFALFRRYCTSYRDIAGSLRITDRNDASLNSGAIGSHLSVILSLRPLTAPIVVFVDDQETLGHAMHILPRTLRASAKTWCPMALDIDDRNDVPDIVMRSPNGKTCLFETK